MDTLTFWYNITRYKTENVYFLGLMNSATKNMVSMFPKSCYRLGRQNKGQSFYEAASVLGFRVLGFRVSGLGLGFRVYGFRVLGF